MDEGPISKEILSLGLSKILKEEGGIRLFYYNLNTVRNNLCYKLKDPTPLNERSVVYAMYCPDCPSVYVGETSRQLKIRAAKRVGDPKSAFGAHLMTTKEPGCAQVLLVCFLLSFRFLKG